ncbi:expressed unknown protein [Seminavis robusta]|uniref:Uncharacterized protein n=1 Tax=Seminavis robusta TaxID=568900 RepID=A0A9N8EPX5_9STRA|nr:expressed unknown protein [Seminavis robusta]|eukprot:Sro1368_g266780.1 n/a (203) ;mRNA; f:10160-10768
MMLVPVGLVGFKYWDKHHRRRSADTAQEPPTFREFLETYMYYPDEEQEPDNDSKNKESVMRKQKTAKPDNPQVASAILSELCQVLEPNTKRNNKIAVEEWTMSVTSSYSFSTAEDDDDDEPNSDGEEESLAGECILSVMDGLLEYESEEEAQHEEEIDCGRIYGDVVVTTPSPPRRNKKRQGIPPKPQQVVSWTPSFGSRLY